MTTADWALVLSVFSFAVFLAGFVWNVWSKFIYPKARVRTSIAVMEVIQQGAKGRSLVTLSATNYGPTDVTLYAAVARKKQKFWRSRTNTKLALLQPYHDIDREYSNGVFSGGLPKKVAVGEQFAVHFPVVRKWAEESGLQLYGFNDTFGRNHWCSRRTAKEFRAQLLKEPAANPTTGKATPSS